jgi:hypothetical protein
MPRWDIHNRVSYRFVGFRLLLPDVSLVLFAAAKTNLYARTGL